MLQIKAEILSQEELAPECFLLKLKAPVLAKLSQPGQFVHLKVDDSDTPFLRRPFSLHWINPASIEVLYQVKGQGTRLLSRKKKGESVDLIGPLGNGFDLTALPGQKKIVLLGGGIGVAPLLALAGKLVKQYPGNYLMFFIGARSKEFILEKKRIGNLGLECFVSTDDGSYGEKGMITGFFRRKLETWPEKPGMVFACGPGVMLKIISDLSRRFEFPCQISLEEKMACGVGACLGCTVRINSSLPKKSFENKLVCKDGPVFKASEVMF